VKTIQVALRAPTPLSHAGLTGFLWPRSEFVLLPESEHAAADVAVVCCGRLTPHVVAMLRRSPFSARASVVLIVSVITEAELLVALECRVVAILPRVAVTADRLAQSVIAAAESAGVMPPHVVQELLRHIERPRQESLTPQGTGVGLSPREIDVLRLMADGWDTNEIANELCYSERTVKNVVHGVTHRLKLRNRSHAVAYAVRAGII
jgi:DNA-binding NarL/FixJ family response regulator